MNVDVLRRNKYINIERVRHLPYPGQVLVREGEMVHPDDIIAEASLFADLQVVDVALGLGVPPSTAQQYLVRNLGEALDEGDVIAKLEGRLPRLVRVLAKGTFLEFIEGKAIIATGHSKIQLKAGMRGFVKSVLPEQGVIIAVEGSLLQGAWGNGKIAEGVLRVLDPTSEDSLASDMIKEIEPGLVIASGVCSLEKELIDLLNAGPSGLIFSAMAPSLLPIVEELPVPVILLQGFGDLPYDMETLSILNSREGARVTIIAAEQNELDGQRPEVIIPGGEGEAVNEIQPRDEIAVGQKILILSGKNGGMCGEVVSISEQPKSFESGLLDMAVEVKTSREEVIESPGSNLVILDIPG